MSSRLLSDNDHLPLAAALAGVALLAAACGKPASVGQTNSLIVVTSSDSIWELVEDTTRAALEATFFSVREEQKYYVRQIDTASTGDFHTLRTFRQVIVFGTPDDPFVREVARAGGHRRELEPGTIVLANDVWARDQLVTAVVLDPDRRIETWERTLPVLLRSVESNYRDFVRRRMYVSGADTSAADSLRRRFGFSLRFPRVYHVAPRGPEGGPPIVVRNDNPDPSQLIRSVLVDWGPVLDTLTAGAAYEWRAAVDSVHYNVPQAIDRSRGETIHFQHDGRPAVEATGVWEDEGTGFPSGGPFISRLIQCPERTFFLDAWVYAPGKDKYQYVLQVREILDSFSCGRHAGSGSSGGSGD